MFSGNTGIISIPCYDTSKAKEMYQMFGSCSALVTIPLLDTSTATNMELMFAECTGLKEIPLLNTQNVTTMGHMFTNCKALQTIPPLNTSKVTNFYRIFDGCTNLVTIPLLDASSITNTSLGFRNTSKLEYFGGLKNLKVALDLSTSTKLTHDSLMNVINNLYDLASNGLSAQTLTLGETNLAKLTEEEQAIAVNKGWTLA